MSARGLERQRLETALYSLSDREIWRQVSLFVYETVPSTNAILWELLAQGKSPPLVAIAAQQTAGRGQWGRTWESPRGGLYLSAAVAPGIPAADAPHLTLCSAWGIASALRRRHIPVLLKWPNDLILQGRKLGGIKCETRSQQGRISHAVIGAGLNWHNPVPALGIDLNTFFQRQGVASLASLEELAAVTLDGLLAGYQRYRSEGMEALLPSYLELLASLGRSVTVDGKPGTVTGVTCRGELKVRLHSPGAAAEVCLPPGRISLGYGNVKSSELGVGK